MDEAIRSAAISPRHLAVLNGSEWFASLDSALQQALLMASRLVSLPAGASVFLRDDPNDGVYCVMSGAICIGATAPSGKGSIVALAEAPEWFGEVALFDGGLRTHDAWADVASTLLHLPLHQLMRIVADEPAAWRYFGRLLVRKLRIALTMLEDMALEAPRVRLARCLLNLSEGYDRQNGQQQEHLRISQERLGMMLALSRQTVNEMLRDLEQQSIIECRRGGVRVVDRNRLRAAARTPA